MKKISLLIILLVVAKLAIPVDAQNLNWSSLRHGHRHIINVNTGWDYAASFGLGYDYALRTKIPSTIHTEISLPAGNDFADDLKAKFGGQARVFKAESILVTITVYGIFRRAHSQLATLENFGSEFTGIAGYYKSKWYVAAEFGFDKAIATHIRNSDSMKDNYPDVRDGWYVPTGGNFHFGVQGGYSIASYDVYLKVGQTLDQRFELTAAVPYYFQLGVNKKF